MALILSPASAFAQRLENPLGSTTSVESLILRITEYITEIGIPIAAIFIIISGFMFLAARGNEEKLKTAKTMLLWTIVGTVIIVGARVLAGAAVNFAQNL